MTQTPLPTVTAATIEQINEEIASHPDGIAGWTRDMCDRLHQDNGQLYAIISRFSQKLGKQALACRNVMCVLVRSIEIELERSA